MKIQTGGLSDGIHEFEFTVSSKELDLGDEFQGDILVKALLDKANHQILVKASVRANGQFHCDRCVQMFQTELLSSYQVCYVAEDRTESGNEESEIRVLPVGGTVIDLTEDVRQTAILSVPLKLLCKDTCQGLCPECGSDLNKERCGCRVEEVDPRWESLKEVLKNN